MRHGRERILQVGATRPLAEMSPMAVDDSDWMPSRMPSCPM